VSESADLVEAVIDGREIPGLRVFTPIEPFESREERPITVDQTNRSVVVGERVIVKWMRTPGADRSPRLLAHLAEAGFTRMPTPHAALFRGGDLIALVTQFLPEALDGWDWGVDTLLDALDGGASADFGAELGTLAAELHIALATPTSVIGTPVTNLPGADDWKTAAAEAVAAADDDWVRSIAPRLAADLDAPARHKVGPALLLHGDLHVGQILKWRDGYAITDFDGHPTAADRPEPVARDVAQLRTSVLHVAEIANRRTDGHRRDELLRWGRETANDLLRVYRFKLKQHDLGYLLDPALLRPFEVEQECRELVYAARFLPHWQYAPMGVLKSWYDR
jgi:maltokinase